MLQSQIEKIQIKTKSLQVLLAATFGLLMSFSHELLANERCDRRPAAFQPGVTSVISPSKIFNDESSLSPELQLAYWQYKSTRKQIQASEYIPLDIQPTQNDAEVANRLADKSITSLLQSDQFRQTTLGRTTDTIEKKLKQEVVLARDAEKSVDHKLNFQLEAFQSIAKITYSGYTDAALVYQARSSEVGLEVREQLFARHSVSFSHSVRPGDYVSRVDFQFSF